MDYHSSQMHFDPYGSTQPVITKLMMIPTRQYHDVHNRQFEINTTTEYMNILENTIPDQLSRNQKISPIMLAKTTPDIIKMSDLSGPIVKIANGWSTVRLRFILEVEKQTGLNTTEISYIQGFSDYHDPSIHGRIDPYMPMHINSVTNVIRTMDLNGHLHTRVLNSFNILSDPYGGGYTIEDTTYKHCKMLRPKDIADGIGNLYRTGNADIPIVDNRSAYGIQPFESKRMNTLTSFNVAEVINSFIDSNNDTDISYDSNDLFSNTQDRLAEMSLNTSSFIRMLSGLSGIPGTVNFNLANLQSLRPDVENILIYVDNTAPMYNQTRLLDTEYTERLDVVSMENTIANSMAENISSLLIDEMLSDIDFSITNMTPNSELVYTVNFAKSFIHGIDIAGFAERFISKLKYLVMPGITKRNMLGVALHVHADMLGDTTIAVGLNGNPPIVYRLPTFCNSLYTPVLSNSSNYNCIVEDMSHLVSMAGINLH